MANQASTVGGLQFGQGLMPERSVARGWIKISLLAVAAIFLTLAAARPRTGSKLRTVETEGREIMLVVDVSNSMLAEDIEPSRMERQSVSRKIIPSSCQADRRKNLSERYEGDRFIIRFV